MKMTAPKQSLKSLTFAVLPKREVNPVQDRRYTAAHTNPNIFTI
jgi:hypothetical protein